MPKQPRTMHTLFQQHLQETRTQLQALNNTMEHIPPFNISVDQMQALHDVLRHLDFQNEYKLGGKIRKAFRIELDTLKDHKMRGRL